MLNIGGGELLIILLVALVFLGPTRLPEVARQVGQTVSSLRSLARGFQAEMEAAARPDALEPQTPASEPDTPVNQIAQANAVFATDPTELAQEARKVSASFSSEGPDDSEESDDGVSAGGPTDLGSDEEE